jgi:hypothetical protein
MIVTIEGIWTVEAYGAFGWENHGFLVLEKGRVIGGNNSIYYWGAYRVSGDNLEADWIVRHFGQPRTFFGEPKEEIKLKVTGSLKNGEIHAVLRRPDRPEYELQCRFTRHMDLPTV